jgi:hypothetical protein
MMVSFKCSECNAVNRVDDGAAGTLAACEGCGALVQVPTAAKPGRRSQPGEQADEPALNPAKKRPPPAADEPEGGKVHRPRKRKKKKRPADDGMLGQQTKVFAPSAGALRVLAVICGVAAVGGLASCILSMFLSGQKGGLVAVAVFALPGGLLGLYWTLSFLTLKVEVHPGGLVYTHRAQSREISWDEIRYVWQAVTEVYRNGGYVGTTYVYTIELADRTQLKFSNDRIKNVEQLGEIIIERTSEAILPHVRTQYGKGDVVNFGKLRVSTEGLHYGKQLLGWNDVQGVKIADGYISVSKRGKWVRWCSIAASSVPNLQVFLTFVNEIVGVDGGGHREA